MSTIAEWPFKDPDEVLDYEIKWAPRMAVGDTIASVLFTVVQGSVIKASQEFDAVASTATVWLSGGLLNETCLVLCEIVTAQGRTMDKTAKLKIKSK